MTDARKDALEEWEKIENTAYRDINESARHRAAWALKNESLIRSALTQEPIDLSGMRKKNSEFHSDGAAIYIDGYNAALDDLKRLHPGKFK